MDYLVSGLYIYFWVKTYYSVRLNNNKKKPVKCRNRFQFSEGDITSDGETDNKNRSCGRRSMIHLFILSPHELKLISICNMCIFCDFHHNQTPVGTTITLNNKQLAAAWLYDFCMKLGSIF